MIPRRVWGIWRGIVAWMLIFAVVPTVNAQGPTSDPTTDPVLEIMSQMSPAERVGQLVLVSFPGAAPDLDSEIAALIRDYGVGGVILRPANGNFGARRIDPLALISMTNQLQSLAEQASQAPSNERGDLRDVNAPYIPLFVATTASAEGMPITAYISRTTSLPTPMALGATWNETLAETAGYVMGRELSALGINLFLGPDLDVMLTPHPGDPSDLGSRVFGSHPFWVGELGRAYIQGMHQGSEQRMLAVPRHLPGLGSADRPVSEEIPTIQKSLIELEQNELVPFFAAMEAEPGADAVADGVLVTHNRYRGFEGNIRISTQPISLDAQALQLLLSLEQVAGWREAGGVLVSENLGLRSIRKFYNPEGTSFNARRVVQEALIAGNDLLILDKFSADEEWSTHFANIRDTLEFLTSLYESDTTFQSIVDEAVYRVVQMKLRAFPEFSLPAVSVAPDAAGEILAEERSIGAQTAMNALTLIFPLSEDLLPSPPREDETMVIFTQEYDVQPLPGGPALPLLQRDTLSRAIQRFYGPQGTGVIEPGTIQSFTFSQLRRALETGRQPVIVEPPLEPSEGEGSEAEEGESEEGEEIIAGEEMATPTPAPLPISNIIFDALEQADWIIFAPMGLYPDDPNATALKDFLRERAGLLDAQLIVLSFGPPYELDSTEISKLDLYYALYSPGAAFVEAGVRALFRDLVASGASPVNIPALNYDIMQQTKPDPAQMIGLNLVDVAGEVLTPLKLSNIRKGDVVNLRTGVILDRNGHPVPNGTSVRFILSYPQEGIEQVVPARTQDGIGATSLTLDRVGQLDITAQSEPALSSVRLQLTIREDQSVVVTSSTPTPTFTPSIEEIDEEIDEEIEDVEEGVEEEAEEEGAAEATSASQPDLPKVQRLPEPIRLLRPQGGHLLGWALVGTLIVGALGIFWGHKRKMQAEAATRLGLMGAIASLAAYVVWIAVGRFQIPAWYYGIVQREFLAGGITLGIGSLVVLAAILIDSLRRSSREAPAERASRRTLGR